jgi:antitoxin component YwqK of YwqJK toxin-antitoxin module
MKYIFYLLLFFSLSSSAQSINYVDADGKKQGVWKKTYKDGNLRYEGAFKNDVAQGIFYYYYKTGELKLEKEFFHKGTEACKAPLL